MPWPWCFPFKRGQSVNPKPPSPSPLGSQELGLKILYEGPGPIEADIITVHGLNGHRERSWTAANGTNWLCDLLPVDMPNIRVISWGYEIPTEVGFSGKSSQQLTSEKLILDLWEMRSSTNTTQRPIVFIAHSLGGTIAKSALLYSDSAQETPGVDHHSVKLSTRGAIFMGTPELDSRLAGLQSYLASAAGSGQESSDIYKEAHWLVTTLQSYALISQHIWTLFVHERPESSTTEVPSDQGHSSHAFIKADHGEMIKFETGSPGYLQVKNHLIFVLKETAA